MAKQEISSILIEGGAQVLGSALKNSLVDKMVILIAPKILGDESAKSSAAGFRASHVDQSVRLENLSVGRSGKDIVIQAYVHRHR